MNFKENVNTIEECCDFCNENNGCIIWSLQIENKRCWIKSERGPKFNQTGVISGYSNECNLISVFL